MANSTRSRKKPLAFWRAMLSSPVQSTKLLGQAVKQGLYNQRVNYYRNEINDLHKAREESRGNALQEVMDSSEIIFKNQELTLTESDRDLIYQQALKDEEFSHHLPNWVDRGNRDQIVALYTVQHPWNLPDSIQNDTLTEQLLEAGERWDQRIAEIRQYDVDINRTQAFLNKAEVTLQNLSKPKNKKDNNRLAGIVAVIKASGLDYQATLTRQIEKLDRKQERGLNTYNQIATNHLSRIAQENLSPEGYKNLQYQIQQLRESDSKANQVEFMVDYLKEHLKGQEVLPVVDQIYKTYLTDTKQYSDSYQGLRKVKGNQINVYRDTVQRFGDLKGFSRFLGLLGARLTANAQTKLDQVAAKRALRASRGKHAEARAR